MQDEFQGRLQRGRDALRSGDIESARVEAKAALRSRPGDAHALALLGDVAQREGDLPGALDAWQRALAANPGWIAAMLRVGSLLAALGRLDESLPLFSAVARSEPGNVEAAYKLAKAQQLSGRLEQAAAGLERVVESEPDHVAALVDLGDLLGALNRPEAAMTSYERALRREPDNARALLGKAWLQELTGDYAAALETIGPLHRSAESRNTAGLARARLTYRLGDTAAARGMVSSVLDDADRTPDVEMRARFLMGDLLDREGRHDEAFAQYAAANRMKPVQHDAQAHSRYVDALINFFDRRRFERLPRGLPGEERPLFIVGMPRSGTSLAEQILASHPAVMGGGERLGIYRIERELEGYPDCLERIEQTRLAELAEAYLEAFAAPDADVTRITDKFTTNFLALGLIQLLFPDARVVHCTRDPEDTALSCFFQDFLGEGLAWSYDLGNIGRYLLDYRRLMAHWRQVLSLPILDFSYEALTADPESNSRKLVEFAGLDWEPACMDFHRQPRVINTASYAQVREPIYRRSVGRAGHYARHLGPLREILEAGEVS